MASSRHKFNTWLMANSNTNVFVSQNEKSVTYTTLVLRSSYNGCMTSVPLREIKKYSHDSWEVKPDLFIANSIQLSQQGKIKVDFDDSQKLIRNFSQHLGPIL